MALWPSGVAKGNVGTQPAGQDVLPDSMAHLKQALADRYRLERELGRGGMATVYLAQDLRHDRQVALKVLRPELVVALGADRFLLEIKLTAKLHHPHILPLFDSGETDGRLWYTMPYIEGESLQRRLDREKRLSLEETLGLADDVLAALECAHGHGIVHRDIKPGNILLDQGQAVLADFGIAQALSAAGSERLTATGLSIGTPSYMSPEQAVGHSTIDGRSDLYSLGCVLFECLAGEPPFTGTTPQAVIAERLVSPPPALRGLPAAAPPWLEEALQRALAKDPADRYATAEEFRDALLRREASLPWLSRKRRSRLLRAGAALGLIGAAALGVLLFGRRSPVRALDQNLVAVAPFNAVGPGLELWREGLVDVLARSLDGAGPLRTVSPVLLARKGRSVGDHDAAARLGRSTGARWVVFGSLIPAGPDSVRLVAQISDAQSGGSIGEIDLRESAARVDRLTDSTTVGLIRELGRRVPIGAVRQSPLAAVSLPVLRSFLRGEQFFRHTAWDSAMAYYGRAVALDSGFAIGWRRMNGVRGCGRKGFKGDPLAHEFGLRAGALNRGLAPRDSLLIAADSLSEALFEQLGDTLWREHHHRLFSTLKATVQRYPGDPEVWYELGEALYHWPTSARTTPDQVQEAFDRAIALDSAFGPAYVHPIELELQRGRIGAARRYLDAYLALNQTDPNSEGMAVVAKLITPDPSSTGLVRQLDSASSYVLFGVLWVVRHVPDSLETAVQVARSLVRSRRSGEPVFDEPGVRKWALARALADRGHLREAYRLADGLSPDDLVYLAMLGGVPSSNANAAFREWMGVTDPNELSLELLSGRLGALSWWSHRRDTVSLQNASRTWESLAEIARPARELELWARYGVAAGQAHLALARGDTAEAVVRFTALPDTVCACLPDRIITARLLTSRGQAEEAMRLLERVWPGNWDPNAGMLLLERARAADRLGRREEAAGFYQYLAEIWREADPELQAYVTEAKARGL
jgi:serine/threonine-protein kinase